MELRTKKQNHLSPQTMSFSVTVCFLMSACRREKKRRLDGEEARETLVGDGGFGTAEEEAKGKSQVRIGSLKV